MKDAFFGITAVLAGIAGYYTLLGMLIEWGGR